VIREQDLVARAEQVGAVFLRELDRLAKRQPALKEARGKGLMIALELASDDEPFCAASIDQALLARGFLVGCTPAARLLRFYPPLIITQRDIRRLIDNLEEILKMPLKQASDEQEASLARTRHAVCLDLP
jgi:4-aminobutyrate aminotransferase-like enzyme